MGGKNEETIRSQHDGIGTKSYSKIVWGMKRYSKRVLEARGGIEPPIKVLQTLSML
jgi:hypothetical protein